MIFMEPRSMEVFREGSEGEGEVFLHGAEEGWEREKQNWEDLQERGGQRSWIRGHKGVIGFKRGFRYQRKKGGGVQMNSDDWLLKEYLLAVKRGVKDKYANYTLCVLKRKKKKKNEKGSPTEDEISAAAADIVVTDEWLREELGDDDLVGAPGDDYRALPPIDDDCSVQQKVNDWILEDHRLLVEEESSIPTAPDEESTSQARVQSLVSRTETAGEENRLDPFGAVDPAEGPLGLPLDAGDGLNGAEQGALDEWLDGDVEEECSILAAATAPPSRGFDFGDFRYDHFAAWDVFGDPWAVGTQQMQMLPVV